MKNKWKNPIPLKNIGEKLLKEWTTKFSKQELFYNTIWKRVVGERVAKYSYIERISNDTLIVIVGNSTWMNELTFLKENIKIQIQNAFNENKIMVKEIIFKLGKIPKMPESSSDVPPRGK